MAKRQSQPYLPSAAGIFRFREERSKIILKKEQVYLAIAIFSALVLLLHFLL